MNSQQAAKIFNALSHPNRVELYLKIVQKNEESFETGCDCFITDIIESLNIGAPTISHHLKELSNAGLIHTEKRGKFLVCKVNKAYVDEIIKIINS